MHKYKYLGTFTLPIATYVAITSKGLLTYLPLILLFVCIPIAELFLNPVHKNLSEEEKETVEHDSFYSLILYLILPIHLALCYVYLSTIDEKLSTYELVGRILSMGITLGVLGINVGHELGHRKNRFEQFLGEILLTTSLETHFIPYHNSGHHFNVATPNDPATARKNEWLYTFWFRSQIGSYIQAWQLETKKLKIEKKSFLSIHNRMLFYTILQIALLVSIYFFFGLKVFGLYLITAIIGIISLETVNYIEHYGLLRKKKKSGRYEVVTPMHSWNSDHLLGRIVLFELSRHSDHHHRASKHYQLLDSHKDSPQMLTGYPGMMLIAFIPPLWFNVMNKRLPN